MLAALTVTVPLPVVGSFGIVQLQVGGDLAEAPAHGGDAEVLRAEGDRGVMRVKTPRHGVYSLGMPGVPRAASDMIRPIATS